MWIPPNRCITCSSPASPNASSTSASLGASASFLNHGKRTCLRSVFSSCEKCGMYSKRITPINKFFYSNYFLSDSGTEKNKGKILSTYMYVFEKNSSQLFSSNNGTIEKWKLSKTCSWKYFLFSPGNDLWCFWIIMWRALTFGRACASARAHF